MNKKILIGSIIAVAILILVSFTGVVGYQTTSSTIARASPLFRIRTQRAIGQGEKDITTDYLGYGEEINIRLSSRMKRTEQAQKATNIISKMDDKAFRKLVVQFIIHLKYQERMTGKEISDALQTLYNIRENPNDMKYYDTKNNPVDDTSEYVSCRWFPGCNILDILVKIVGDIISFITSLFGCYPATSAAVCPTTMCPL